MPISLKFTLTGFEVDISDFGAIVRDLVEVALDQQAAQALKNMIAEVRKNFDMVVDVLTPLYAIPNEAALSAQWPAVYGNFKNTYMKQWNLMRTHCHVVIDQIERIKKAQDWKRNVPLLRTAVQRLEFLGDRWISQDEELTRAMSDFFGVVNDGLTAINDKIILTDVAGAFKSLRDFTADTEPNVLQIKSRLEELGILSAKL